MVHAQSDTARVHRQRHLQSSTQRFVAGLRQLLALVFVVLMPGLLQQAAAQIPPIGKKNVKVQKSVCFKVETAWINAVPGTAPRAEGGDFWRVNKNQPARGATIAIESSTNQTTTVHTLDDDGCLTYTPPPPPYTLTISSAGVVNGIAIESYTDWVPDGPDADTSPDMTGNFVLASQSWPGAQLRGATTLVLPASDLSNSIAWHAYALIAYALHRSTYNLGDFGNTSSCGAPDTPCCGHSAWPGVSATTLYSYTMRPGTGYASRWEHDDKFDDNGLRASGYGSMFNNNDGIPALGSGVLDKWQMAHELGHVIVMQRMGGRTETNYSAALYGCMGQYWQGNFAKPADTDTTFNKAPLSREFSSGAAREGWAHFFAAQLFNDVGENDCWYDSEHYMDIDLDGDIDNDYPGDTYKDGVFSCEGAGIEPLLGEPIPSDPLASWVHARDWLDEVWQHAPACGSASSPSQITGRSSQYDWMRYFWDMASDENVSVETLTDIYVDMCPTEWVAGPPDANANANWPELRLERSATFHGVLGAHNRQKSNGVDHY